MKKKKVTILLGSPRKKGNSIKLANQCQQGIIQAGGEPDLVYLHNKEIKPCAACDSCQKNPGQGCVIQDDFKLEIGPTIENSDAIVFASPIYWFTFTAQLKICIDRCYSLVKPDGFALSKKPIGIILTYGGLAIANY